MRLKPVAIRIDRKGGVVAGTVILADARLAVVAPARGERAGVKGVDAAGVRRHETEMQPGVCIGRHRAGTGVEPQPDAAASVAQVAITLGQALVTQRLEGGIVEALGARQIADADGNVIEHESSLKVKDSRSFLKIPEADLIYNYL